MGDTSTSNNVFNWVGLGIVDRFIYLTGHRAERGEKGKLPTGWREATDTNSGKPVYKFEGEKQWQWARPSVEAHQWAGPRAKMFFKFLDECEYQYGETGEQYPNNVGHPSGTFTKSCYNIGSRVSCHWKTEAKPPKAEARKATRNSASSRPSWKFAPLPLTLKKNKKKKKKKNRRKSRISSSSDSSFTSSSPERSSSSSEAPRRSKPKTKYASYRAPARPVITNKYTRSYRATAPKATVASKPYTSRFSYRTPMKPAAKSSKSYPWRKK